MAVLRIPSTRTATVRPLLLAVVAAQVADAISFAIGVAQLGIGVEGNPLMRAAYEAIGIVGVLAVKGVAVAAVVTMLAVAGGRFPRFVAIGSAVAIGLGLLGATMNTAITLLITLPA